MSIERRKDPGSAWETVQASNPVRWISFPIAPATADGSVVETPANGDVYVSLAIFVRSAFDGSGAGLGLYTGSDSYNNVFYSNDGGLTIQDSSFGPGWYQAGTGVTQPGVRFDGTESVKFVYRGDPSSVGDATLFIMVASEAVPA